MFCTTISVRKTGVHLAWSRVQPRWATEVGPNPQRMEKAVRPTLKSRVRGKWEEIIPFMVKAGGAMFPLSRGRMGPTSKLHHYGRDVHAAGGCTV